MKKIHIGQILMKKRHEQGITQEKLAEYIGVSKASVSKWETETTYPDITLLPQLAAFFHISIDELVGYEPQLPKEDIRKLYQQLSKEFTYCPFDEVIKHCQELIKQYYSCMPLLFEIGALYVNHSMMAENQHKTMEIINEARKLFARVKKESEDLELAKQALSMEAFCFFSIGKAEEVIDLLEPLELSLTPSEPLLAKAYQALGNRKEAKEILQVGIYQSIIELLNFLSTYMELCFDDMDSFEKTYQRTVDITKTFDIGNLHPSILLTLYLCAAQGFMTLGRKEKALELLENYAELVTSNIYPLHLHGDSYFYLLDEWMEDHFILGCDLPRNESIVRRSMIEAVADNPIFAPLSEDMHYQNIVRRLKEKQEVSL